MMEQQVSAETDAEQRYLKQLQIIEQQRRLDKQQAIANAAGDTELARARLLEIEARYNAQEVAAFKTMQDEKTRIEQDAQQRRLQMAEMTVGAIASLGQDLQALGLLSAKQAFNVQKAADLGQAITSGIVAVQKAIALNPVPPFPLAILTGAAAAANVARIAATQFPKPGSSGAGSGIGGRASGAGSEVFSGARQTSVNLNNAAGQAAQNVGNIRPMVVLNVENKLDDEGLALAVRDGEAQLNNRSVKVA
jgi:hypothetical protein